MTTERWSILRAACGVFLCAIGVVAVSAIAGGERVISSKEGANGADVLRPYEPVEPKEVYVGAAMDRETRLWVRYSYQAATHGDLLSAIEMMQIAANTLVQRRNDDFELWDNLGELYCAQANREPDGKRAVAARANGTAMLAEFRCAAKVFSGSQFSMDCKTARGIVPNPAFTPLCYQLFCTEGDRDKVDIDEPASEEGHGDSVDPYALYLTKFHKDASNLPAIEKICRRPKSQ